MDQHILCHIHAKAIANQGIEHLHIASWHVGMCSAERINAVKVLLMNITNTSRGLLHFKLEHLSVEISNLQWIGYLCVVHLGILAIEDTMTVDVIQ